jgi:CSLREA domain-containing protein
LLACLAALAINANAATLIVDSTSDSPSLQGCTAAPGDCSLRGAMARAFTLAGEDVIDFDIPMSDPGCVAATGVCTISLAAGGIGYGDHSTGRGLTIDGYTQPGASPNTLPIGEGSNAQIRVELAGGGLGFAAEFTVRGLAFLNGGISAARADGVLEPAVPQQGSPRYQIHGNFFGLRADGVTPVVNSGLQQFFGVDLFRGEIRGVDIGGPEPAQMNVYGGTGTTFCIQLRGNGHRVRGNLIGTDRSGRVASSCGFQAGIQFQDFAFPAFATELPPPHQIGGLLPGEGNLISGLRGHAIANDSGAQQGLALVQGNRIGVAVDGVTPLPNLSYQDIFPVPTGAIRGDARPTSMRIEGNLFGPNGLTRGRVPATPPFVQTPALGQDVGVWESRGNRYRGMQGMTVDIVRNFNDNPPRTPNDPGDPDQLQIAPPFTNRAQNFPEISAFALAGDQLTLSYRVDSLPAHSAYPLRIEFYRDNGRGDLDPLGSDVYAEAEAQQLKQVVLTLPAGITLGAGDVVVGHATTDVLPPNRSGETSESTFYPLASFSFVSLTPATVPAGVPYRARVRVVAAPGVPFKPNGRALIVDGRGNECIAFVQAVAAERSGEGECELVSTGAPGSINVVASYSASQNSFALATGAHPANVAQTLTLTAGITSLELVDGNNQTAEVGAAFAQPLRVRALGAGGAPVAGIPVQFSAPATGASASFAPNPAVSGADGIASTTATAINTSGSYTVTARVGALTQSFNLSNEPGLATALAIVSNLPNPSTTGQTVTVTTALNPQAGGPPPTGVIAVSANTGEACSIVLPAVSCALSFASLGQRLIQASYTGDANYRGSKADFATQTVQPGPSLHIDDVSQNEGGSGTTNFLFTVTLDNPLGGAVSVDFATANDTAVAPGDYSAASGTLSFSGSSTRTISVAVVGDTTVEPDERFFVNLSNASGATISRGQGIGTILNDDQPPPPAARIDDATVTEATDPDEEVLARFRVQLDRPAPAAASLRVRTVSGSAQAGADFDANDFVLAFAAGERERFVEVFIRADATVEPTETFTIELSEPQGLTLADAVATGMIFDAAFDGVLTVTSAADPGDGNCTPAECTLREAILLGNTLQSVAIHFAIPGAGPHTIRPLTPLPIPAAAVHTLDGYTQPGSRPNALAALQIDVPQGLDAEQRILLDGSALGAGSSGLTVLHGMSVRGLAIGGFAEAGIRVRTDTHRRPTRIVGNALGSDGLGASARPNGVGLRIETGGAVAGVGTPVLVGSVGGRPASARNLISGNREAGVRLIAQQGTTQRMAHLDGNVIGMDAGLQALANGGPGIDLSLAAPDGLPTLLLERNLIGGNAGSGIRVLSRSETPSGSGGSLLSNAEQIGVPVANGLHGLELGGPSASVQGLRFEQTRIGPHPAAAVRVLGPSTRASVVPARLPVAAAPVDLGPQGPTPNDPGDVDSGPNGLLNTPLASSARFDAAGARIQLALTLDTPAQPGLPLPEVLVYAEDESGLRRVGAGSLSAQGAGFAGTLDVLALPGGLRVGSALRVQTRYGDAVSELSAEPVSATGQQLQATVSPVREAAGALLRFVITLDGPVIAPVSISYRSRDGSASAGLDYTTVNGGGTLSAAQPSITVDVPVLNDTLVEINETVLLEVASSNPGVAAISAAGLISDDDRLRQDRGQYDPIQLEQLAGLDGFIVDHPASATARLIDLGDFNGDTRRDLALGLEDRMQLLLGLPRPVPARVSLPAAGSAEFPLITRGFADVFDFGPTALGALRGASALPSLGLRSGVLHGRSAPLPASATLASLAVPPEGAALSGDFGVPLPVGDVNGDGRTDFLLRRLGGGGPLFGVVFGQPAGTALPASLAGLNGSNGFVLADPGFSIASVSAAADVDGDGRADLLLRRVVGTGSGSRAENRLLLGRASWPASVVLPGDTVGVRTNDANQRTGIDVVAGDFNGDGFGDLVLRSLGGIELVFGNGGATGLGASAPVSRIEGLQDVARVTLVVLPDHNGNRAADLAIGDAGLSSGRTVGRVAILYGRASWPASIDLRAPPPAFVKFLDGPAGSTAPEHLAALGDYNGDGLGELAITMQGRSYVLYSSEAMFSGSSEARPPDPAVAATRVLDGAAPAEVAVLGGDDLELLPAGDVDGDGRADLLLGRSQPYATAGDRVPLLLVPGSALAGASTLDPANPPAGSTRFRQSASVEGAIPHRYAAGGDFDGDGLADLAFLRYGNPVRLAVLRGRPGGLPAFVEPMRSAELLLGFSGSTPDNARELRYLGDIDGDGFDDLGVLRGNPGQLAEVEVVYGRAPGGADRRATISAAPGAGVVLPNQPKLGRIRSGVAADAFVLGLSGAGAQPMMLVLGGPGFPTSLNLNAPGERAVRLTAGHWRGPQDAVIVGIDDVSGDGIADVGVAHQPPSADGAAQGVVALIPGRGSWPAQLDLGSTDPTQVRGRVLLRGGTALNTLITGLAALPDQNGDGRRELLISLGQSASLGAGSGRALLLYGPALPSGAQSELVVNGELRPGQGINLLSGRAGTALQFLQPLGDLDGDGRPELIGGSVPDAVGLQGLLYRGLPSVVRGSALAEPE